MARLIHCPACRGLVEVPLPLNSVHVFLDCMAVEGRVNVTYILDLCRTASISGTRIREGIRDFITRCWNAGRSADTTLFLYVNGKDHNGDKIMVEDHLKRGRASRASLTCGSLPWAKISPFYRDSVNWSSPLKHVNMYTPPPHHLSMLISHFASHVSLAFRLWKSTPRQ